MKYLQSYEAYKIIDFIERNNTEIYFFKSPKNIYEVKIIPYQGKFNYYAVGFGISEKLGYNTNIIVNENPYEIMNTIFKIVKTFSEKTKLIKGFIFSFTGDKIKNNQRLKLYTKSINKYLPNSKVIYDEGIFYVKL
jgi:hypothetical protein